MAKTVRTLLFSDIEGSTALLERAGEQYAELLSRHRKIVRAAVGRAGGIEHGTEGDSFFITFDSPSAGLAAAVEAQREIEAERWPEGLRLRVRIGMHVGEVLEDDDDLVGMSINHAARIAATAHGGQVVVSDALHEMARTLPDDVGLLPLGTKRLRDVGSIRLYQVVHPQLQQDFPELRGVLGYRTNLPHSPTPYVGGDRLLAAIAEQVAVAPLVTLTGSGGVGKTRAAIEFARGQLDQFDDGVFFIDLAPISDTGAVAGAVASALPLVSGGGSSLLDNITDWMGDRNVLLVIDNCEHLVGEVCTIADAFLARCVNLKILTTSREALGVGGERVHRVPSLDIQSDALELFSQRATAADASFSLDGQREAVAQICNRLDGIPLAIELAAARMRSLSPSQLLERLEDRFRLLRGSGRGTLDRHHTLRATVTWSYQLLDDAERLMFDRLSVFAGGFDLRAAESICGFGDIDELDVIDLVSSLVDKSMVVAEHRISGGRYRLLETLRQFGEEQVELRGESVTLRERHLHHYAELVTDLDRLVHSARQNEGVDRMTSEWDNVRAAHLWALAERDLRRAERLVVDSLEYANLRMIHEHAEMIRRTVQLGDELAQPSSEMLGMLSWWTSLQGDEADAIRLARLGLAAAPSPDHPATHWSWFGLSAASPLTSAASPEVRAAFEGQRAAVANIDDLDRAWPALVCLVDAAKWARPADEPALRLRLREVAERVQAPHLLTYSALYDGVAYLELEPPDFDAAEPLFERGLAIARDAGDLRQEGMMLRALAVVATGVDRADATARCHDALATLYEVRWWQKVRQILDCIALALAKSDRVEAAATILGHLDANMPACGVEYWLEFRQQAHRLVGADGEHTDAAQRGTRLSADELVAFALERTRPSI